MQNISNYLKATLFFDDIRTTKVKREQGFTLQQFHYECARKRNDRGMPYGPTQTTILQLQIKSLPDGYLKEIYKRLDEHTESCFSIVFNATFRTDEGENTLSDYDSGLVVTGYVISVDEAFGISRPEPAVFPSEEGEKKADLMMTSIRLLTQSITYIGSDSYQKTLYINF
ncbi:hypothetical protein [Mediterranea massiliensis]|uniref:hypothetical protein n=1 Tax=Mediterranea massiliensis TaxID=1841865 RepID=UPI001114BE6D|nr:hypothetical protein [Mediterranea massiliensis]